MAPPRMRELAVPVREAAETVGAALGAPAPR